MDASSSYGFRRAVRADKPLIDGWLRQPHVAAWWGPDASFDVGKLADPRQDVRIVTLDGRDIGYMQDYDPHGWEVHPFAGLAAGARGTDQFIGPAALVGQGHGPRFIAARMAALFAAGAPVLGTVVRHLERLLPHAPAWLIFICKRRRCSAPTRTPTIIAPSPPIARPGSPSPARRQTAPGGGTCRCRPSRRSEARRGAGRGQPKDIGTVPSCLRRRMRSCRCDQIASPVQLRM